MMMMVVVVVMMDRVECGDGSNRPATTRLSRQVRKIRRKKMKPIKHERPNARPNANVESSLSVIVYPLRQRTTQLHATAQQRDVDSSLHEAKSHVIRNNNTHTQMQSHDTCIGGDLDTDPALRFRIGGSYIFIVSVSKTIFGSISQANKVRSSPGSWAPDHGNGTGESNPGYGGENVHCKNTHLLIPTSCMLSRW